MSRQGARRREMTEWRGSKKLSERVCTCNLVAIDLKMNGHVALIVTETELLGLLIKCILQRYLPPVHVVKHEFKK